MSSHSLPIVRGRCAVRLLSPLLLLSLLFAPGCIPEPDPYPYRPPADLRAEARAQSAALEAYIAGWLDGRHPPEIPADLLPPGLPYRTGFRLAHPDSVSVDQTWGRRLARPIDTDALYAGLPDPNVTYLLLGPALAPFGSRVHVEGEFPHCRFFSLQLSPPFSGEEYNYDGGFGPTEVSIADVDIEPEPGHTNPFRVGADRDAELRRYHVTFDLAVGNAVDLSDGRFAYPYRYPGNQRFGGLLQHQGPWGINGGFDGLTPARGAWITGSLWVRLYAPDQADDPLGGVAPPRVYYTLPDGRPYFITADFSEFTELVGRTVPARTTDECPPGYSPTIGWAKSYGVLMNILSGVALVNGWTHPDSLAKIRAVDLGATGRSQFADPPRNYEAHATTNNYANYLGRPLTLPAGQVAVLTGRLPTFPDTRSGLSRMTDAQVRYWSVAGYDTDPFFAAPGSAVNAVMDDEVATDGAGNYLLVFSRPEDRPANAAGQSAVTWVDWGPTATLSLLNRWVTLGDAWNFPTSPTEANLPWPTGNPASPTFDSTLIFRNHHDGFMGCYLPRVHLMTTAEFEALGDDPRPADVPIYVTDDPAVGPSDSRQRPVTASSVFDGSGQYAPARAVDGSPVTRWVSATQPGPASPQQFTIDLGADRPVSAVKISWGPFEQATDYTLDLSVDGSTWTTVHVQAQGRGGTEVIDRLRGVRGRYVRLRMNRALLFNYGLANFEVYGPAPCLVDGTTATSNPPATNGGVRVFPNPAREVVHFSVAGGQRIHWVELYGADGRLLHRETGEGPTVRVGLGAVSGVVFYRVGYGDGRVGAGKLLTAS